MPSPPPPPAARSLAPQRFSPTFTLTIPVANSGAVADDFILNVGYPTELTVTKTEGQRVEFVENGSAAFTSLAPLAPGETATVTMTFRADKALPAGKINADVHGMVSHLDGDEKASRAVSVTAGAIQPVANTKSTSDTNASATKDLAYTGSSPVVALVIGGLLLAGGTGLLLFLRRRRSTV